MRHDFLSWPRFGRVQRNLVEKCVPFPTVCPPLSADLSLDRNRPRTRACFSRFYIQTTKIWHSRVGAPRFFILASFPSSPTQSGRQMCALSNVPSTTVGISRVGPLSTSHSSAVSIHFRPPTVVAPRFFILASFQSTPLHSRPILCPLSFIPSTGFRLLFLAPESIPVQKSSFVWLYPYIFTLS